MGLFIAILWYLLISIAAPQTTATNDDLKGVSAANENNKIENVTSSSSDFYNGTKIETWDESEIESESIHN